MKETKKVLTNTILLDENQVLPWHELSWVRIQNAMEQERLPHALLFHGQQGMGKLFFAEQCAKLLLCNAPVNTFACGHCRSCLLMKAQTHSDYHKIQPDDSGKIKIEQVRELISTLTMTSGVSLRKLVIIDKPENMQNAAANALLKTLEEPPGQQVQFLLVSNHLERLSATIRSRCQKFFFPPAFDSNTEKWLSQELEGTTQLRECLLFKEGAPLTVVDYVRTQQQDIEKGWVDELRALQMGQVSPLEIAQKWSGFNLVLLLDFMQMILTSYIQQELTGKHLPGVSIAKINWKIPEVFVILDKLQFIKHRLLSKATLNAQLVLEDIMLNLSVALRT